MIKKLLVLFLLLDTSLIYAGTIKTDVLVVGGGASGVAAAIQSARSKIKTMLIEPGPWLGGSLTAGAMCRLEANRNLPSGIYSEFKGRVTAYYHKTQGYDTARNSLLVFGPAIGASLLKKMTDTVKNLTVKLNTPFTAIGKDGSGWDVGISVNGKTEHIKAKIVVDATELGDVAAMAGALFNSGFESRKDTGEQLAPENATNQIQDITHIAVVKDNDGPSANLITRPENYNAQWYTCLKPADVKRLLEAGKLPNNKYLINWSGCANQFSVTSDDLLPENRDKTFKAARLRTLGLMYYLQTELGYSNLILSDEFNTADHLPYTPCIRENRRAAGLVRMVLDDIYTPYNRGSKLFRTSIGVGDALPGQHYRSAGVPYINYPPFPAYSIPLGAVVLKDIDNLLVTEKAISVTHIVNGTITDPAVQMNLGQGVGAVAAYCAFFKTTTKNLKPRVIQGEILDFKGCLAPFADVPETDPAYRAVQQIGVTGLLPGFRKVNGETVQVLFKPDTLVTTAELKPVLLETYARAFIWFSKNNPGEQFTVANLLSLISEFTLTDPINLQKVIQAAWKSKYKFSAPFNLKRPVTRREFAVLANQYLNPFAREVDISGKITE